MTASALSAEKAHRQETWKYKQFTLKSGTKAYKGGRAAIELSSGKCVPATSTTGLLAIGMFAETVDASDGDTAVTVDLEREITVERFTNATSTDACAASDVGNLAYMYNDQVVTITASGRSVAGRIWDVDSTKGVAIEKIGSELDTEPEKLADVTTGSFTSNAWAPTSVAHDTVYAVPSTGAASTITLPAAAADGTRVYFAADGTANGHTVQYKDETGPTNLTTALTASKRHLVVCVKESGNWVANAYVSP